MNEYAIFILSAAVSVVVNALGRTRRSSGPLRILVVKLDHLGDVVLATPALGALRERYPDAAIDVLVHPGSAVVVEHNPAVTRVVTYRSERFARPGPSSVDGMSRLREIARAGYDVIVELRGDERTLLLPFLAGATRRVDRGTVRIRESLRRRARGAAHRPMHEVEVNLEVVLPLLGGRASRSVPAPPPAPRCSESSRSGASRAMRGSS
jgi:ADP-heptose:LPS heptosyltransferase